MMANIKLTLTIFVLCSLTLALAQLDDDIECPAVGVVFTPHENCSKYYVCDNGILIVFDCPSGLFYNPEQQICDFPFNVPECVGGTRPPGGNTTRPTDATTPPTNSTTPTPPSNSTTPTPPSNSTTPTPPTNSTTPTPPSNSTTPTPPSNSTTPTPPSNSTTPTPPSNSTTPTPPSNSTTPTPPSNSTTPTPPSNSTTPTPPTNSTTPTPPSNSTTPTPPSNSTTPTPPSNSTTPTPPSNSTTPTPPSNSTTPTPPSNSTTPTPPSNSTTPTPPSNGTTPLPNGCPPDGIDKIPNPDSCGSYFLCVNGVAREEQCAEGLQYNPILKECDFPENVNCTVPVPTTTTPTPIVECPPEDVSFHPYPGNCSLYVICVEGFPLIQMCVSGLCFDPVDLQCRANNTVAFEVPKVVETVNGSELHMDAMAECKEYDSESVLLVPSKRSCEEFSICHEGLYKGTMKCQSGFHFDFVTQGCVSEDLSAC